MNVPEIQTYPDLIFYKTPERDLTLDLYRPTQATTNHPAVILAHGGAWETGEKGVFEPQVTYLVERGYVVADITYRLSTEAQFPAALKDLKAAVQWLKVHSETYSVDPNRIAVGGHSAGAHLAALASVTTSVEDLEPDDGWDVSSHASAVIGFSGTYDFTPFLSDPDNLAKMTEVPEESPTAKFLGGDPMEVPNRYRQVQPIEHVTPDAPPTLLLHGTNDSYIEYENAVAYRDALADVGVSVELFTAIGGGHNFLWESPWQTKALFKVHQFLQSEV